ncbi:MAG: PDZ domain-containing protein [Acidobacteria bacterium]|jgi:serine protease Do|nr:MAG: PDZ domain-containing protein [Acidobacteriota bacterium]GIU83077.1 MAG: peptidase [Pyrinomonadaceae bacterium]
MRSEWLNGKNGLAISILFLAFSAGIFFGAFSKKSDITKAEEKSNDIPKSLSASFAEVIRKVEPAVVSVRAKYKLPEISIKGEDIPKSDAEKIPIPERPTPWRPNYGVGSGFIVEKSGYIITNYHVIEDSMRITVTLQNGEEYTAKVVGVDEETDLAVLKIDAGKDLPTLVFGDSDAVQIGEWVLAIGSPFGLARSVTAGIVSQTNRETPFASPFQRFIQTDAAINRGNSGGPLVNMDGEVIGVNSQIATSTGNFSGVGFALPSKEASFVLQQILRNGKVRRGYLGVTLDSVRKEFAKVYNMPEAKGAIITNIVDKKNSPAAISGLQVGDIIVEFNGHQIIDAQDLIEKIASIEPGTEVSFAYLRENNDQLERKTGTVKLGERPSLKTFSNYEDTRKPTNPTSPFGLILTDLTPSLAKSYNLEGEKGVLVKGLDPTSFIGDIGFSGSSEIVPGDLIQRINRQEVTDVKSFNEIANKLKPGDAVVLHVASYNRRTQSIQKRIVQFTVQ